MRRIEYLQIRIEPELKAKLKGRKGDMSSYVRGLIEKDLGSADEGAVRTALNQIHGTEQLPKLIKQLEAQGRAPGEAKALAEKRLEL